MIRLSVVIITFNEEKNIGRCLDSVKEISDDIVVIDSFSTDKTKEVCQVRGVRFIQHQFDGHIEQKNWAVSQAKYQHILSLDADEALSDELKKSILAVKNNWKNDGYYMNRLTNYCGKWIRYCGWYPDKKLRLFDSKKGIWGGMNPHDKYELYKNSSFGFLEGNLLHYSYYTIEEHKKQAEKFSGIAAKALYQKKIQPNVIKLYISPLIKFISSYFLKLGFLEGNYGFIICKISSHATFLKYKKLKELYKAEEKN